MRSMKNTFICWLIVLLGIYLVGCSHPSHTTKATVTDQGQSPSQFNVLDYGAVGDDKTDNTQAFSNCLAALVDAGGGTMLIPDGVFRGRILIPGISRPTPSWMTIEIVGQSAPTHVFGTIGNFPLRDQGTILKCLEAKGPAVIYADKPERPLYASFSGVNVVLRNLDIRTYDNPAINGVDLSNALQCNIESVFINTGVYNVQAKQPTHHTSGLITPANNNAAWTALRNVTVTGYHNGIVVNEHTEGQYIVVASNRHGLLFNQANHASRFGRVGAYRNTNHLTIAGHHGFSIEQLNTEQPGPNQTDPHNAWQALAFDVNDPKNLGLADINYWVVIGNVGARDVFTINGGQRINARRIGSAQP